MTAQWIWMHSHENYDDYEPSEGMSINGWATITLDFVNREAYATVANPLATPDNDLDVATGETVPLWRPPGTRALTGPTACRLAHRL